jgi:hypothetical protein
LRPFPTISFYILLSQGQRIIRAVEVGHLACSVGDGVQAKATRVGKNVEEGFVGDVCGVGNGRTVLPLIQVKAAFVPLQQIDAKLDAIFLNDQRLRRRGPAGDAVEAGQPFLFAHVRIRPLHDALRLPELVQRCQDRLFLAFNAHRERLHHQKIAVFVDDEAGQAVGLGVDQAVGGGGWFQVEQLAVVPGLLQTAVPKPLINWLIPLPTQQAHSNLGVGIVVAGGEETAVAVQNLHQIARLRIALHPANRPGKQPRMPVQHRFFSARF